MIAFPKLNGRAFILIGVAMLVMVMLAVPVRGLIREKRDVADLQNQVAAQQTIIDDLQNRKLRIADPAYLQALARTRLNYVFPGEVGLVVLDKQTATQINTVTGALVPNDQSPWYNKLWNSTRLADKAKTKNDPLVVYSNSKSK